MFPTFVNDICRHLRVRPDEWNAENLKEGAVDVPLLALHVLQHHVQGQLLDHLDRLRSLVLLAVLQDLTEICWKRPESIRVDCSNDILVVDMGNIGRLKQRPRL